MKAEMVEKVKRARRVSTPIIAVRTAEPASTIAAIAKALNGDAPKVWWDCAAGWRAINEEGDRVLDEKVGDVDERQVEMPQEALRAALRFPEKTVVFFQNLGMFLQGDDGVAQVSSQALWNLREEFKTNKRTAIVVGSSFTPPGMLTQDVYVIDEELPTPEEHAVMLRNLGEDAEVEIAEETVTDAAAQLRGLSCFAAEQASAEALNEDGSIDVPYLIGRKRQMIDGVEGLQVLPPDETFDDVGGCDEIKRFLRRKIAGKRPPACIVFIDEIEKSLGGGGRGSQGQMGGEGDRASLGVLRYFLTEMQDQKWTGSVFVGPPGCSKSMVAKCIGAEAQVPLIALDIGSFFGPLLGVTEERSRAAMKVIKSIGGQDAYFVATSNNVSVLPPELRRRFSDPTWFFDVPMDEERIRIWRLYLEKFDLKLNGKTPAEIGDDTELLLELRNEGPLNTPFDTNWVGADIVSCCRLAWEFDAPVHEAAGDVVSVYTQAEEQINSLRKEAAGRYRSASFPGMYQYMKLPESPSKRRRMKKED